MKVGAIAPDFNIKDEKGDDFERYKNLDKKVSLVPVQKLTPRIIPRSLRNKITIKRDSLYKEYS